MPDERIIDRKGGHIKEWFESHYQEIREENDGKFLAVLEPDEFLAKSRYNDLIEELEKKDVELEKVAIAHIPKKRSANRTR
ncbi:MAG: hypothetical protein ACOCTN_01050 [Candidatus Natronoplasma sp.]